ncbi:capsular biosynthesis protein [Paraburkholderia sp. BR14263]|uniref:capsular polysaccharide export protein, LipB/KpsS family n=1 Tax=unclassified Paraburkholderia TaxID=2615204 RepID=UPI0034CF4EF0
MLGYRPRIAWSGPPAHARRDGRPPLSWLEHTVTGDSVPRSIVNWLNAELACTAHVPHGSSEALIRRTCASWIESISGRHRPAVAAGPTPIGAVAVVIDERRWTYDPATESPHPRRATFEQLLATAREMDPRAELLIVRSSDPGCGNWLSVECAAGQTCGRPVDRATAWSLIGQGCNVYTLGASEGLLALLQGANVHVFGAPMYAGWGLTQDQFPLEGRTARPTSGQLFHAIMNGCTRYTDPHTHKPGHLKALLKILELQGAVAKRFEDLRNPVGIGIQRWKRPFISPFLSACPGDVRWSSDAGTVKDSEQILLWGTRSATGAAADRQVIRVEDGFLHSCGLGSDLHAPSSQIIDRTGIYFDPRAPGDLIEILNTTLFDPDELVRASLLRQSIVANGLTKYNLGRQRPTWSGARGRKIVLVVGQVADDASVVLGAETVRTMEALVDRVRAQRPHAFLVYRPHPDVIAGNRNGLMDASSTADVVDMRSDIVSLIEIADEVHTLTSLAGFDALLRGKAVFTYGTPFYAGWGLTSDAAGKICGRARHLSIDMLTAGVLLRYPLYWDWTLGLFTTPEAIVAQLARCAPRPLLHERSRFIRLSRKTLRWSRNQFVANRPWTVRKRETFEQS